MTPAEPWNHNIAYFPFIEREARSRVRRSALDVGTGDGMLAARLAAFIPSVVGLDSQPDQIEDAAARYPEPLGLRFEVGDVLAAHPADAPFDFVVCSATLHHLELAAGLNRLAELTAPGGTLVIVGLARNASIYDRLLSALSVVPVRIARAGRGWHEHGAPKKDPAESWADVHRAVSAALPGARFRRRLYWRYSVVWNRPRPAQSRDRISPDTHP
jgi:SAM-dependent methyltransferase